VFFKASLCFLVSHLILFLVYDKSVFAYIYIYIYNTTEGIKPIFDWDYQQHMLHHVMTGLTDVTQCDLCGRRQIVPVFV